MKAYPYEIRSKAVLKVPAGEFMSRAGLQILLKSMGFIQRGKSNNEGWRAIRSRFAAQIAKDGRGERI